MDIQLWKKRKKELHLTHDQLAEKSGASRRTIAGIFSGDPTYQSPTLNTIESIERALGLNQPQTKKGPVLEDEIELNDIYPIKIIGEVTAGVPIEEQENIEGVVYISYRPPEEYFSVRVHGDSMKGIGLLDRDVLIVHKQETVENGEICVAMVNGKQTVKRFRQYGSNFFLMPENPDYDPIPLNPGDDVIFLGKVVEWRHIL